MTDLPAPMPHPEGQPANDATQSTGPTSAAVAHDVFETEAARLATVPIWLLALSGTLRLADGRLSFRTRSKTLVDAPLSEIHSVAENAFGLVSWQGETQHRFTFGRPASARLYSNNLALAASALPKTFSDTRTASANTSSWLFRLEPLVDFPPPGLVVPPPWPKWKTLERADATPAMDPRQLTTGANPLILLTARRSAQQRARLGSSPSTRCSAELSGRGRWSGCPPRPC